jgi:hypothetical protein
MHKAKRRFEADKSPQNATNLIVACMRAGKVSEKNVRYCAALVEYLMRDCL